MLLILLLRTSLKGKKMGVSKRGMNFSVGLPQSLLDALREDPDRFVDDLKFRRDIVDKFSFVKALVGLYRETGNNSLKFMIDNKYAQDTLFNSRTIKSTIKENVGEEGLREAEAYSQDIPNSQVQRSLETFTIKKSVKVEYFFKNRKVAYSKTAPRRFSNPETKLLTKLKQQGLKPKSAMEKFRQINSFPSRTDRSISAKFYRV